MVLEPEVFDNSSTTYSLEGRCARAARRRERQLAAYRHDGFWQCMDTLRDKRCWRQSLGRGQGAVEGLAWQRASRQSVLARSPRLSSPAATGLSGGWLVRRLVELEPTSSASCATGCPQSELVAFRRLRACQGRARRRARPGAARAGARRVRDRHRLSSGRADDRRHRQPQPGLDVRDEHRAAPGRCSRPCRRSPREADRRRLVRQGVRRPGAAALRRDDAAPGPASLRRQQVVRRPDRAARTRRPTACRSSITRCGNFYGGGDLNWNRIVPGTIRSVLRGERPVIRSDGQFVRDYFYVEDGAAAYMLLAERLADNPTLRARRSTSRTSCQVTVLEVRGTRILGADEARPRAGDPQRGVQRDRDQ